MGRREREEGTFGHSGIGRRVERVFQVRSRRKERKNVSEGKGWILE